jgi:hypothetical protein
MREEQPQALLFFWRAPKAGVVRHRMDSVGAPVGYMRRLRLRLSDTQVPMEKWNLKTISKEEGPGGKKTTRERFAPTGCSALIHAVKVNTTALNQTRRKLNRLQPQITKLFYERVRKAIGILLPYPA